MIYADHAATTKMSRAAIDAMLPYLDTIYGNPSSLHSAGQKACQALLRARNTVSNILGCHSNEIYFTSGGSEANHQAILSAALWGERTGKKHLISTQVEHHCVLHTLNKLQKQGFEVSLLAPSEDGIVCTQDLINAIRPDTALVSVMYANNEIGTIQPIPEIGAICRERGILFHTDAVQAVGQLSVHVQKDNVDFLALSAHKFHGPKGAGVLYAKRGTMLTNLIEGGPQERGKRAGTENLPAISGMATALTEAVSHMDEHTAKLIPMRDRLIQELTTIPGTLLNGDRTKRLPGNVNVCFEGIDGESLLLLLNEKGICASSGSACTSGSLDPSHVLLAIGRSHELAQGSLRLSLSAENTLEEIETIIQATREVVKHLRGMSPLWKD